MNASVTSLVKRSRIWNEVRFNVLKVEKNQIFGTARKQFRLF